MAVIHFHLNDLMNLLIVFQRKPIIDRTTVYYIGQDADNNVSLYYGGPARVLLERSGTVWNGLERWPSTTNAAYFRLFLCA